MQDNMIYWIRDQIYRYYLTKGHHEYERWPPGL